MNIGIVLGIVFAVIFCGGLAYAIWRGARMGRKHQIVSGIVVAAVALAAFVTVPFSFHVVDTGEIAVVKHLGEAREIRTAGTHFDFWMTETYSTYDAKVQNVEIDAMAYSSDAQTMNVTMTLQYQIMGEKVIDIAKQYGSLDILENRIQSIAIEKTKSVLSSYKAMDIISERSSMSPRVEEEIKNAIAEEYYVTISTVVLTNIDFSDAFEKAVEDKMIAEQKQLQAQYENETKVAAAKAEADAKAEEAKAKIAVAVAEAEAKLELAQADAETLRLKSIDVARMLGFVIALDAEGKEYIDFTASTGDPVLISEYLKYIEYLGVWNGELPGVVADGSAVVVSPNPEGK